MSRFHRALVGIAFGALVVRIAYVLVERRDFHPQGDAFFYHATANLLADGKGFISPFVPHAHRPAAEHPPLYSMYLAIASLLGMRSVLAHLLWSCVLGTASVVSVGLVGRQVGGEATGVIAAVIAAIYPNMWAPDGMLQAETLAIFAAIVAVYVAYRYCERPTLQRYAGVGVAVGFGALARSELILLVPLLLVPLAWRAPRDRLKWCAASIGMCLLVIAPWSIYNQTRFTHPVILSAQLGPLLSSANCDSTYYGGLKGYFDIQCTTAVDEREGVTPDDDESVEDSVNRRAALDYVRGHLSRLPYVESVRLLRINGLYRTDFYVHMDTLLEGRELWISRAALWSYWVLAVASIAGVMVYARARDRALPLFPLLAPIGVVIVTVLVTYASTRFRAEAEPVLCVLAALAFNRVTRPRGSVLRSALRSP